MYKLYLVTSDPNGNQVAERPAIAYTANGSVWIKTESDNTSSGWELILGDGT